MMSERSFSEGRDNVGNAKGYALENGMVAFASQPENGGRHLWLQVKSVVMLGSLIFLQSWRLTYLFRFLWANIQTTFAKCCKSKHDWFAIISWISWGRNRGLATFGWYSESIASVAGVGVGGRFRRNSVIRKPELCASLLLCFQFPMH